MKKMIWGMLFWLFMAECARAEVKIIDGDSLVVDGVEMRLEGIDAPEYKQVCYDRETHPYRCGIKAHDYMSELVKKGNVRCKKLSVDRYHRQVSICYAGKTDLNREMVKAGWAVAYDRYSDRYVPDEKEARKARRGIWQGKFMKPELWRRLQD